MDTPTLKAALAELHFAADLPAEVLDRLSQVAIVELMAAGHVLFREGTQNRNWYLVSSGRVALEMNVPGRGAVRILTLGPGEMVAWSALVGEGKMTATAVAVEDSELVVVDADTDATVRGEP